MDLSYKYQFKEQGFAVIPNFLTEEEIKSMKQECSKLVAEMDESECCSIFVAGKNQVSDDYFITSGDKIRFFFEKDSFNEKGERVIMKETGLNKIGHALHWLNPLFKSITFSPKVKALVQNFGFQNPAVVQSMYIFKHPGIGGEVTPHQDGTYLHTVPLKVLGLWFPLEDATCENGCLWFIPGSHKDELAVRFIRNPENEVPKLIYTGKLPDYDDSNFVPIPVSKGSCVLIDGAVVHKSEKNTSKYPRPVYTFHVVEQHDVTYSNNNWLQSTAELPFPPLFTSVA